MTGAARGGEGPVVVVAGPTASGKSRLAVALAHAFDGVVINADSLQLYRQLAVLTARPTIADMGDVPHRLYGVLDAEDTGSAAGWMALARAEARRAWATGRLPILTGGTGLYLAAFLEGLADVPDIPGDVRAEVRRRLERNGPVALHGSLARHDPAGAARLRPGDSQRVTRALEVLEATGRPLAWWQGRPRQGGHLGPTIALVLDPPRERLHARCDRRFGRMLAHGALDEAAAVLGLGLAPDRPARKALGLRELCAYLEGRLSLSEASRRARQATRRYAKRQTTWFRHQMPRAQRLNAMSDTRLLAEATRLVAPLAVDRSGSS